MAVLWIKQSLKKINEKKIGEQTIKDEIRELQDALVEIAEIVAMAADVGEDGGTDG